MTTEITAQRVGEILRQKATNRGFEDSLVDAYALGAASAVLARCLQEMPHELAQRIIADHLTPTEEDAA